MKNLYKVLESILSGDLEQSLDVPKEIEKLVKICKPLKFKADDEYASSDTVYKCPTDKGMSTRRIINRLVDVLKGTEEINLNDYIHDSNVTLIGVVGGNGHQNGDLIIAVPRTNKMISLYSGGKQLFIYDFRDERIASSWNFDTGRYQWYKFPVVCFDMIKTALLK